MEPNKVRSALPAEFDVRVRRALELPMDPAVVLAVMNVAMAKSPRGNYRYTLTASGALHYVQHSRKADDWQVPFDRPLPSKPSSQVSPAQVSDLLAKLKATGFFSHPGYEADPTVEDGTYWILRARDGKQLHSVVYQNVPPRLSAELAALSDPLWTQ